MDNSKQEVTHVTTVDSNMYPTLTPWQLSAKGQQYLLSSLRKVVLV